MNYYNANIFGSWQILVDRLTGGASLSDGADDKDSLSSASIIGSRGGRAGNDVGNGMASLIGTLSVVLYLFPDQEKKNVALPPYFAQFLRCCCINQIQDL